MFKKIVLVAFLLSLSAIWLPEIVCAADETIYELSEQLSSKFPTVEAIKVKFGDGAEWEEETMPSPHDPGLTLYIKHMKHPEMEIRTMGYASEDGDRLIILFLNAKKAGFVDFLGVDIGSSKEDVVKKFGSPQETEGNELRYKDENEFCLVTFIVENNKVVRMSFSCYPD
ncbi:MAG: hypothetical protein FWF87_08255 [Synergistaceae bacterium]|nr:hypothetical protein [Synergistaceae bacterium]